MQGYDYCSITMKGGITLVTTIRKKKKPKIIGIYISVFSTMLYKMKICFLLKLKACRKYLQDLKLQMNSINRHKNGLRSFLFLKKSPLPRCFVYVLIIVRTKVKIFNIPLNTFILLLVHDCFCYVYNCNLRKYIYFLFCVDFRESVATFCKYYIHFWNNSMITRKTTSNYVVLCKCN